MKKKCKQTKSTLLDSLEMICRLGNRLMSTEVLESRKAFKNSFVVALHLVRLTADSIFNLLIISALITFIHL